MVLVILRICIDDGQPKDYQYKEPNRKNDPKKKKEVDCSNKKTFWCRMLWWYIKHMTYFRSDPDKLPVTQHCTEAVEIKLMKEDGFTHIQNVFIWFLKI